MLDQFKLSSVLQRLETFEKTGMLVLRQGKNWVELYIRDGRLLCIGPVRTNATLAERLLASGIISQQVFQETMRAVGAEEPNEARIARTLMELNLVEQKILRSWTIGKTLEVLQVLLTWPGGEIYFEETVSPEAGRLLVSMSISSLLSSLAVPPSGAQPIYEAQAPRQPGGAELVQAPVTSALNTTPSSTLPDLSLSSASGILSASSLIDPSSLPASSASGMLSVSSLIDPSSLPVESSPASVSYIDASQLLANSSPTSASFAAGTASPALAAPIATENSPVAASPSASLSISPPVPVRNPVPPKYVDPSYMRPEMVLLPADLAVWREQNPSVQLTPDQWRLLTRVNGYTTLQAACQELAMPPEMICRVAAELVGEGLVHVGSHTVMPMPEPMPAPDPTARSVPQYGYAAPGYASAPAPLSSPLPSADVAPQYSSFVSFETESQWGNGANGATFVAGRGWLATPQPLQSLPPGGPLASYAGSYVPVGNNTRR
jgi:hypothetical protein